jgi:hypothetical protein
MSSNNQSQLEENFELQKQYQRLLDHANAVRENIEEVYRVKEGIANDDLELAAEYLYGLSEETKQILWRAPRNGGVWTTREREMMSAHGELAKAVAEIKRRDYERSGKESVSI